MVDTQIAQGSAGVGSISNIEGEVTITRADGETVRAESGSTIFQGDTVITADGGSVNITFIDDTNLSLDENSEMVIDEMVFESTADSSMVLNVLSGTFAFVSGEVAGLDEGMRIETPVATIGIRGTAGAGSTSEVVLLEEVGKVVGEIYFKTKAGTVVLSQANQGTGASNENASPSSPRNMTPEEIQEKFGDVLGHLPPGLLAEGMSEEELLALAEELEETDTAAGGDQGGQGGGGGGTGSDGFLGEADPAGPRVSADLSGQASQNNGIGVLTDISNLPGEQEDPVPNTLPTITIETEDREVPDTDTGEDTEREEGDESSLVADGTVTVGDLDVEDTATATVVFSGASGVTAGGDFNASGMMFVEPDVVLVDDVAVAETVNWSFDSDGEAFDYLAVNEDLVLTYTITVTDSKGGTASHPITITIHGTNDTPTLTVDDYNGSMDEGDGAAELSATGSLSFADADFSNVIDVNEVESSTTVSWNGFGPLNAGLVSALKGGLGITQNGTNNTDGSWTYSTDQNLDFLQDGETITVTFTLVANDGVVDSDPQTVTVTITGSNDAPVITGVQPGSVGEEDATSITGQVNVVDVDSSGLTYRTGTEPTNGDVTINPDGSYVYVPDPDYFGDDSFTVEVSDDGGVTWSDPTNPIPVTVNPVADAPHAVADVYNVDEDGTLTVDATSGVLFNDHDDDDIPNPNNLSAVIETDVSHGSLTLNSDGSFTYTPTGDYNGPDSFSYKVVDDGDASGDGENQGNIVTVTLNVNPTSDAPEAVGDAYTVNEDGMLVVGAALGVLNNDNDDVDGNEIQGADDLSATLISDVTHGSLTLNDDGSFTYDPTDNFYGTDQFTYQVSDDGTGDNVGNTVTVNLTVNPISDAPVGVTDSYNFTEDQTLTINTELGVLSNDHDNIDNPDPDTLSAVVVGDVSHGDLTLNSDGSFSYTPDENYTGSDSFTYQLSDSGTGDNIGDLVTVNLSINAVSDAPIASADAYGIDEDGLLVVNAATGVLSNDNDNADAPNPDTMSATLVEDVSHGNLTLNADGSFSYEPNADYYGPDSFTYEVSDDGTGNNVGNTVTVSLTINPLNDAPSGLDDGYTIAEDGTLVVDAASGVLSNDNDDGDLPNADTLSATLETDVTHGALTLNSDGSFTYVPDDDYNGPDSFTYSLSDNGIHGTGNREGGTYTVDLNVTPVNDPPIITIEETDFSGDEDTVITGIFSVGDVDHTNSQLSFSTDPVDLHGTLVFDVPSGTFSYTPDQNFSGVDTFTVTVTDGDKSATTVPITVTVNPIADAPIVTTSTPTSGPSSEDVPNTAPIEVTDVVEDGTEVTISGIPTGPNVTVTSADGTWENNGDGTWTYTSDGDWDGVYEIGGVDAGTELIIGYTVSYTIPGGTETILDIDFSSVGHDLFDFDADVFDGDPNNPEAQGDNYEKNNQSTDVLTVELGSSAGGSKSETDMSGGYTFKKPVGEGATTADGFYVSTGGILTVSIDVEIVYNGTSLETNKIMVALDDGSPVELIYVSGPDADGYSKYSKDIAVTEGQHNIHFGAYLSSFNTDTNVNETQFNFESITLDLTTVREDVVININESQDLTVGGTTDYSIILNQALVDQGGSDTVTETLDVITVITGLPTGTVIDSTTVNDGTWTISDSGTFDFSVPVGTGNFALTIEANTTVGGDDTASTVTVVEFGDGASFVGAELSGGDGNDNLIGAGGDDTLAGEAGNDTMTGNDGNDTFVLSAGDDAITDFVSLEDSLDISDLLGDTGTVVTELGSGNVVINYDSDGVGGIDSSLTLEDVINPVTSVDSTTAYTGSSSLDTALTNLLGDTTIIDNT